MKDASASGERWGVVWIAAAAVVFRLVRLGSLSFSGDEETTTLAALALLEGWPPELPGGLIYLRGLPFTGLEAAMIAFLGVSEFALRLAPALLAGPRIVAAWWLARPFLGGPAALGVAGLLAVAPLDVELSRTARMYSMFATLDLLFVALVVRLTIRGVGTGWAIVSGVMGVLTHGLGVMHAPLPILGALSPNCTLGRAVRLVAVGGSVGVAYGLRGRMTDFGSAGLQAVSGAVSQPATPVGAHWERLQAVLALPEATAVAGLGALGAFTLGILTAARLQRIPARLGALAAGAAWALASPVLGALALLGTLLLERLPLRALFHEARWLGVSGLIATSAWAIAAGFAHAGSGSSLEAAARLLLGLPAPNWFEFALAGPGLFALALVGALVAADRGAGSPHAGAWLVLLAAAFAPAVISGLVTRAEPLRYQLHALAPLIVLAVLAAHWLAGRLFSRPRWILAAALVAVGVAIRPDQAVRAVMREHGLIGEPFAVLNVAPDHRGAGSFVRSHAAPGEWIAAEDPLQQRLYIGRADLWLRKFADAAAYLHRDPGGGRPRDIYVGARHVSNLDELRDLAAREGQAVVWLVTSGEVEAAPQWYRTEETHETLRSWRALAWFVGADVLTRVYRLVDGKPVPPADGTGPRSARSPGQVR